MNKLYKYENILHIWIIKSIQTFIMQQEYIYKHLLTEIKHHISRSRVAAIQSVNRQLIQLYWEIGKLIHEKQEKHGWGKSIVERLSKDLQKMYPAKKGLSTRNLWEMRRFYHRYRDRPNLQQLVAEIPWGHNLLIMSKLLEEKEIEYYLKSSAEFGWSRNVLLNQIKAKAYHRRQITPDQHNFDQTLTPYLEEQAIESIKSSYNLEFLGVFQSVKEKELEDLLIQHLEAFLLELGYGFTFVGRQYKLTLGDNTYFVDLLLYNRKLQCLVAFELKMGKFKPEYAGKMNFYLELLDEQVKEIHEQPSLGLILCAEKDQLEVEYALRISQKPMGVVEYQLTQQLPDELSGMLPTIREFQEKWKELEQ